MWPGQFIGLSARRLALPRGRPRNVLLVVLGWPEVSYVSPRRRAAASSPRVAARRFSRRRRSSSTFQITMPFGCQNGDPGECRREWKRSSCEPSRRWSRRAPPRAGRGRVQVGLRVERGAVDPRQLLVVLVAAPVRAGEAGELHRLDRLRVLEVRAAAEVGELALRVEADRPLGGVDELDLVRLALGSKRCPASSASISSRAPLAALGRSPADLRPRSARGPPRGSARGTRSRSRSRSRSAGRSRSSLPGRAAARPRRAGARSSGAAPQSASGSSLSRVVRIWICSPSASGSAQVLDGAVRRTSTACSASFGPIARAASRPVAPLGSSSSDLSGRITFTAARIVGRKGRGRAGACAKKRYRRDAVSRNITWSGYQAGRHRARSGYMQSVRATAAMERTRPPPRVDRRGRPPVRRFVARSGAAESTGSGKPPRALLACTGRGARERRTRLGGVAAPAGGGATRASFSLARVPRRAPASSACTRSRLPACCSARTPASSSPPRSGS